MEASTKDSRRTPEQQASENGGRRAQRRPDRGDPGRRHRGRLPRRAARDQLGDHRRALDQPGRRGGREHLGQPRLRGPAAPRRRPRPRGRHGHHRRPRPRHRGRRHRRPDHRAGRQGHARAHLQPARRGDRPGRHGRGRGALADPPPRPDRRGPHPDDRDVRDRHQGHRPARALRQGRQGRPVRRRRRRQDGHHPGAHQQPRPGARRPVGLLRRGRALPRGQRPLAGDDRVGRHRQDDARVRPDERAARRAHARRAVRPHDGGVLPRRGGAGRAPLHRQHLPLRPGRLGGLRAPGPHALPGGLPADAGVRDGPAAGADHLDPQGLGHLDPGRLRPGGRPHGPGAGLGVRAPQRDDVAVARDLREGHLPGRRPARLDLDDPQARDRRRGALQGRQRGQAGAAALPRAAGHHRHPRHRRALRRGPRARAARAPHRALPVAAVPRRRAVHRHPGRLRADRRDRALVPRGARRQARRPARVGVLPQGLDRRRRRGREGLLEEGRRRRLRGRRSPTRSRATTRTSEEDDS